MKPLDRITGYAHVALRYGLEEAIFLDSLMYWYKENRANQRNYQDGRWWTFNSVKAFQELVPWWSVRQIRRIIDSCKEQGAILAGSFNNDHRDRTAWYTPGDELLTLYGMTENGNCICQGRQMQLSERAGESAQNGKCIYSTCNNHVETNMENPLPPKPSPPGKPNTPEGVAAVFDGYAGEDGELRQLLADFQESRVNIKKPLHTQRAAKILLNKLDRLSGGDRGLKLALLETSILHGWESVYPLKEDGQSQQGKPGENAAVLPEGGTWI